MRTFLESIVLAAVIAVGLHAAIVGSGDVLDSGAFAHYAEFGPHAWPLTPVQRMVFTAGKVYGAPVHALFEIIDRVTPIDVFYVPFRDLQIFGKSAGQRVQVVYVAFYGSLLWLWILVSRLRRGTMRRTGKQKLAWILAVALGIALPVAASRDHRHDHPRIGHPVDLVRLSYAEDDVGRPPDPMGPITLAHPSVTSHVKALLRMAHRRVLAIDKPMPILVELIAEDGQTTTLRSDGDFTVFAWECVPYGCDPNGDFCQRLLCAALRGGVPLASRGRHRPVCEAGSPLAVTYSLWNMGVEAVMVPHTIDVQATWYHKETGLDGEPCWVAYPDEVMWVRSIPALARDTDAPLPPGSEAEYGFPLPTSSRFKGDYVLNLVARLPYEERDRALRLPAPDRYARSPVSFWSNTSDSVPGVQDLAHGTQ
ncbi:MAG TPA: hypothetical protein PLO37_19210 [Candidatus Hydrogenedentes bacterium]|nr:hypothetical protein [Candidatus Hydrogenedentota bacterium]HPG68981.1 hypothetical protein [Candidatus Hydrogenedentota bacterium]